MKTEIKNKELELPPGLPELPPMPDGYDRWEYRGKTFRNITLGRVYEAYEDGEEWFPMNYWPGLEYGSAHYIEAVKSAPIPVAPPWLHLPPGTRYAGQLKDYEGTVTGYACPGSNDDWGFYDWAGMKNHSGASSGEFHIAIPIESEAIPTAPPVVEKIDPAVRLNIAAKLLAGFCANPCIYASNGMSGWGLVNCKEPQLMEMSVGMADALIAAARKQP